MNRSHIRPTRQTRSQATSEKIVAAAEKLMRTRTFDSLSVAQIADEAGVAVGTVYARFSSKDALLAHLYDRYLQDSHNRFDACLATMAAQPRLEDRVASAVDHVVDKYLTYTGVLRSIILKWRSSPAEIQGSDWQRDVLAFYQRMAEALVGDDPALDEQRARFGMHLVVNLCRDFYLFPELLADRSVDGWRDRSRGELRRMLRAYLRSE